jgi:hypothetical protein
MDFADRVNNLSERVAKQVDLCKTEEATKNALIMPLIATLGYDVFDPSEVVPEFTADIGTKKGEKVDYAIMIDDKPVMIFECKWSGADLKKEHASQLHRYFHAVSSVRFGVLTNGVIYQFYSDLEAPNRMDKNPFFVLDMGNYHDRDIAELKKFSKTIFDLEDILATANDLKYTAAILKVVKEEFDNPSADFVKLLAAKVYSGRMTQNTKDQFAVIVGKALRRFLAHSLNERLKSAIDGVEVPVVHQVTASESVTEEGSAEPDLEDDNGIETTIEETEGFMVIRAILRQVVDVKRIHMRDTKSYCGILLDNNNRKPLARLKFNRTQKYLSLVGQDKKEESVPIDGIDDIYQYADRLIEIAKAYEA